MVSSYTDAMTKGPALLTAVMAAAPVLVSAAEPASRPLEELDEVVINGTRLADRILALENSFYQLYNELNKDDQFDMFCTQIPVRRNEPEMTRACLPMFYANALNDSLTWQRRCQGTRACYTPPDPTFVLYARNQELRNHMQKVINSDPRLKEMNEIRSELEMRLLAEAANVQKKRDAVKGKGDARGTKP